MDMMVDLETLGLLPTACIVQIGAVKYDLEKQIIMDEFLVNIDPFDCKKYGLTVDPETVKWWSEQPKAVRESWQVNQLPLKEALIKFAEWCDPKGAFTCQGPDFDAAILRHAYSKVGIETPWKYYNVRCSRTIGALYDMKPEHGAGKHNALADAKAQVNMLFKIFS